MEAPAERFFGRLPSWLSSPSAVASQGQTRGPLCGPGSDPQERAGRGPIGPGPPRSVETLLAGPESPSGAPLKARDDKHPLANNPPSEAALEARKEPSAKQWRNSGGTAAPPGG